jgi:phage shock protein C
VIAGVAGGMAEYLDVDPTVIRILWILATFLGGITILLYPIMAFIVPLAPYGSPVGYAPGAPAGYGNPGNPGNPPTGDAPAEGETAADGAPAGTAPATGWIYQSAPRSDRRGLGASVYLGVLLVVIGIVALADSVTPGWFPHASAGPVVIVTLGGLLLFSAFRRPAGER